MPERIIAIGDVHGCAVELDQLLTYLAPGPDDLVLMLGDLVNRGPDSHRVIEICRHYKALSLMGNHERRLLQYHWMDDPLVLRPKDQDTLDNLTREDWDYMSKMRLTYHDKANDTVFVHGGFLPGQPWERQTSSVVTEIQVVDRDGQARKRSEAPGAPHWSTLWEGPPYVVYGHTPGRYVRRTPWSLGIDTGCAYGGHLTAYVLPQKALYQVKARRVYYDKPLS